VEEFKKALGSFPASRLGVVTGGTFVVEGASWGNVGEWKDKYDHSLENYMTRLVDIDQL
jgi:hypothetical protein